MNLIKTIEIAAKPDRHGEVEQFTWDLFPVVPADKTLHLDENGLPKKGTHIVPGMILVGKIGRSPAFDPNRQPTALEIQGSSFEKLREKYGDMWYDASLYAEEGVHGVVEDAHVLTRAGMPVAVVTLRLDVAAITAA